MRAILGIRNGADAIFSIQRPLHDLPPLEGSLESRLLEAIRSMGEEATMLLPELSYLLGAPADVLENTIRNLQSGLYASQMDDKLAFDA